MYELSELGEDMVAGARKFEKIIGSDNLKTLP